MKKILLTLSITSACIISSLAQANEETISTNTIESPATEIIQKEQKVAGFYIGATVGNAREHFLFDDDLPNKSDKYSETKTAYRFIGGYQFNRIIGVEFDYTDYADYGVSSPTSVTAQANLGYTFHNGLRIFTLQGLSRVDFNATDALFFKDDSATAWRTGGGLEFAPRTLDGLAFRATVTYDIMAFDSIDKGLNYNYSNFMLLRNLNVGITYKF